MKIKTGLLIILLFCSFFGISRTCEAEGRALDQLLEIMRQKDMLSPSEVKMIKQIMAKDLDRLLKKEKELAEKEKSMIIKEKELSEKERALVIREKEINKNKKTEDPESILEKPIAQDKKATEKVAFKTVYDEGFCISSYEKYLRLCFGGLLQTDYRYYDYKGEQDPNNNEFDLRRVHLLLRGHLFHRFNYEFEYAFQGAGSRRLLDAYLNAAVLPYLYFQIGQFKEPFGLEESTIDKDTPFAERSMGHYLTPQRDVGVMAHSSIWSDRFYYGMGIFNGDGRDDSTGGDVDSPEFTGRLFLEPLRNRGLPAWDGLHFGGSYSYVKADRNNVNINVKTTGMTDFFDVGSMAKFNIIREVESRTRYGAEIAWTYGPLLMWGEYISLRFSDVETSEDRFDIKAEDYYGAILFMLTGEKPALKHGKIQPVKPLRNFSQGGWGAFGLAFRYDKFKADDSVYDHLINAGDSVRKATAYTISLNWYLNPYVRLLIDATRTRFDIPLLIDRDPLTGTAIYSDREDVITGRFQLKF